MAGRCLRSFLYPPYKFELWKYPNGGCCVYINITMTNDRRSCSIPIATMKSEEYCRIVLLHIEKAVSSGRAPSSGGTLFDILREASEGSKYAKECFERYKNLLTLLGAGKYGDYLMGVGEEPAARQRGYYTTYRRGFPAGRSPEEVPSAGAPPSTPSPTGMSSAGNPPAARPPKGKGTAPKKKKKDLDDLGKSIFERFSRLEIPQEEEEEGKDT
jgi:hypothetical protein